MPSPRKKRRVERAPIVDDDASDASEEPVVDGDEPQPTTSKPFVTASAGEAYLIGSSRKIKSSAAKLSDRVETFTRASYLEALQEEDDAPSRTVVEDAYDRRFAVWQLELDEGFSVLLHGLGSKRALLGRFARRSLRRNGDVVVIDGFLPSLALADVLTAIETDVLKGAVTPVTTVAQGGDRTEQRIRAICAHYGGQSTRRPLYIVVNNLDGAALLGPKAKAALTVLAAQPRIHLVASIDHVRAPLLFPVGVATARRPVQPSQPGANGHAASDEEDVEDDAADGTTAVVQLARGYNFVHHHTPTFAPYTHEALASGMPSALFPPSIFPPLATLHSSRTSSAARVESAMGVLAAVSDKAKQAFTHLAKRTPTRYAMLLNVCITDMTASSGERLDTLLHEFVDHGIVEEGDDEPANAGRQRDEAAEDADEDEEMDGPVTKAGWIWLNLSRAEINTVLERLER